MSNEINFNKGRTTIEALGASIVSHLLTGRKVVIPELGYLEIVVFPDKRSVLFRATENTSLFLDSEDLIQSSIYNNISVPLKAGKIVVVPEVGIFRTMKNADGSYRVSYTISPMLRQLLSDTKKNESGVKKPEALPETLVKENNDEKPFVVDSESTLENTEKSEVVKRKKTVVAVPMYPNNTSKVGDLVVPQENKKKNTIELGGIIVILVAIMVLVFMVWYFTSDRSKGHDQTFVAEDHKTMQMIDRDQPLESMKSNGSIDLPSLAERKYGNRIFWVYIYEANSDQIASPVNIPAGTELRIPNLWEDYKVDVMDSMEIKRAEILSDIILKKRI
jgi:hypothetical protein